MRIRHAEEGSRQMRRRIAGFAVLVTLYFDKKTGYLVREVRYSASPIGRVPTQADFADYRDVNGIKFPFRISYVWLDGRDAIVLNDIKTGQE